MTKRSGSGSFEEPNSKKNKVEVTWDDWGEDPDLNDLEECIMKASQQVYEKSTQKTNLTLMPTYNTFAIPNMIFTSTQANLPTTSNDHAKTSTGGQQAQIRLLEEQVVAKNGEISILRTKLSDLKASTDAEILKKETEWSEKLKTTIKEMNAIKSLLDFKTLEIANLKQKMNEISKRNGTNLTQKQTKRDTREKKTSTVDGVKILAGCCRKLHISADIFNTPKPEKLVLLNATKAQDARASVPCSLRPRLHNEISEIRASESNKLDLSFVYREISTIMACDLEQINDELCRGAVRKILCVTVQLLHDFRAYLQELEKAIKTEDIRKSDIDYLERKMKETDLSVSVFDGRETCEKEIGVRAKQGIALLAELLPVSTYIFDVLTGNLQLNCQNEPYIKRVPFFENNEMTGDWYFALLLSTVRIIGNIRLTHYCTGFLCAVTKLLTKLSEKQPESIYTMKLLKEIVYARPNYSIMYELSFFLRSSRVTHIDLCNLTKNGCLKMNWKDEVLYINEDSCLMHVIAILYKECILWRNDLETQLKVYENLLVFVYDLFDTNAPWIRHRQTNNSSECISQVVELATKIVYKSLELYLENSSRQNRLADILKLGIRVLHVINLKLYILIEKYIGICSQYKFITKKLFELRKIIDLNEDEVKMLEQLKETEEMPNLPAKTFHDILLWE